MYECFICHTYARSTLAGVMRHIRQVHKHFSGAVRCGIGGCPTTATSYESLRQHLYKKHREVLHTTNSGIEDEEVVDNPFDTSTESQIDSDSTSMNEVSTALHSMSSPNKKRKQEAAKFILKIRDGKNLPQTVVDDIVTDTQLLLDESRQGIQTAVISALSQSGVATDVLTTIKNVLDGISHLSFQGLETAYKQDQFIQSHFDQFVVSRNKTVINRTHTLV